MKQDTHQQLNLVEENKMDNEFYLPEDSKTETEFYDDLDESKRQGGHSCCTLWSLGLVLLAILITGIWLIFSF